MQQVTELWTEYGQLAEIWFDGGYTSDMKANITALLAKTQPNAAAFNGFGVSPRCHKQTIPPLPPKRIGLTLASWLAVHCDGT